MKTSQAEWADVRREFLQKLAQRGIALTLRDRVWAVTPAGEWVALPGTSDSPIADRWWLGCDPDKLRSRHPIGVVLLCRARNGPLHAIGLPRPLLHDVQPRLSKNQRQVFFNVVRRAGRFILQLRGGEEIDVTGRLDDVSWVTDGKEPVGVSDRIRRVGGGELGRETESKPAADDAAGSGDSRGAVSRFFAIVRNGGLHPLDDVALQQGSLYLVEAREVQAVPGNSSLRRIVARGGPEDLPPDFAERHDYYAHGAVRR